MLKKPNTEGIVELCSRLSERHDFVELRLAHKLNQVSKAIYLIALAFHEID